MTLSGWVMLWGGCAEFGESRSLKTGVISAGETQYQVAKVPVNEQLATAVSQGTLRIVTYNVEKNSVFESKGAAQQRFIRLVKALKADIYALQEVYDSPSKVVKWFNTYAPLPGGQTWYAFEGGSAMTVSRFDKRHHRATTNPDSGRKVALTSIDVPPSVWPRPLYLINAHLSCCSDGQLKRQRQADSLAAWIRDLRAGLGPVELAKEDPLVVLGDLNLVSGPSPLETLLTGDIDDESTWGPDAPPDGDGTELIDLAPLHNGDGLAQWTWRNDASSFKAGRLDYILISDSVLNVAASSVLNTTTLSDDALSALGLERLDVGKFATKGGWALDHLPVIADLQWKGAP